MDVIFANSSIGTDISQNPGDPARAALGCATEAECKACHYVKTDGVAYLGGAGKFGLAHVRVKTQIPDVDKLRSYVGGYADVYLVGGSAGQSEPCDSVVSYFTKEASNINRVHAHVKKARGAHEGVTDSSGHVPGFVALVGSSNKYPIGTHSLLGCVGVLIVPMGCVVEMKKIHIWDTIKTVGSIGQHHTEALTKEKF